MKETTKKIILCSAVALMAFAVGFSTGFYSGIQFMVNQVVKFLNAQGVDFSLNAKQIADLIYYYTNIIKGSGSASLGAFHL